MKINNKYKIGTMVMFYELEAVQDFVKSVLNATDNIKNKENITVDFLLNLSEYSEQISEEVNTETLKQLFNRYCVQPFKDTGIKVETRLCEDSTRLYAVGDYRRDLNYFACKDYDFVVWGEADCLMPKEYFEIVEQVALYGNANNIHKYCLTFAVRKMWDSSWGVLEHTLFEKEEFMESTDPRCQTTKSSIWYYMTQEEMDAINDQAEDLDIRIINYPRFDGSLLTISSQLILGGVNIPHAVPCCGEDTAFQNIAQIIMGSSYTQFIIKNILKVHNRNHPDKRKFIAGENLSENSRTRRGANENWKRIYADAVYNLSNLGPNQSKFKSL